MKIVYVYAPQIEQHQEVLDQMWNGIVPVAETRSIHAVMLTAPFVVAYQYYLFSV
jgi:hypothetical protein